MINEKPNSFTLPAPADKIVAAFADCIYNIQPGFIEGIYLTGSIPLHDFYTNKSDIDFLVLCKELPGKKMAAQLKQIHKRLEHEFKTTALSGSYLRSGSISAADPENIPVLSYHEGSTRYQNFEMAPVSLWELKANAFTVFGMPADSLAINISQQKLNRFLYENINSYWARWIKQHSSFLNRKLLLLVFPRFTEWAVLGVARQLYTLNTGKIVSKTGAGYYCLQQLPARFHPVIEQAIGIRKDNRTYPFVRSYAIDPSFKRLKQTIESVNYMIALFNRTYTGK